MVSRSFDPATCLAAAGKQADGEINLTEAALALGLATRPEVPADQYFNHLQKLSEETAAKFEELLAAGAKDNAGTRLAALKDIIAGKNEYTGALEHYDDPQNSDLTKVIDRRMGLPITLGIIYMHVGRAQGWEIHGLGLPGHFLCRLDCGGERIIFDPFRNCTIMQAQDLRLLVKKMVGPGAELSADYFEPVPARGILVRLQNNIKYRQIDVGDYVGALETIERMRVFAPNEHRLLLDAGVLYARVKKPEAAIEVLEDYIHKAPNDQGRHEAILLLEELRASL